MYGNLQEISFSSLLEFIGDFKKSGTLIIETKNNHPPYQKIQSYFIFFDLGKIIYGGNENSFTLERLKNYFYLNNDILAENIINKESLEKDIKLIEYNSILNLYQQNIITLHHASNLIEQIIKEVLFNLIPLKNGHFVWQEDCTLQPTIVTFDAHLLLFQVTKNIKTWFKNIDYLKNPFQCPIVNNYKKLLKYLDNDLNQELVNYFDGQTNLIKLSRYFHQDLSLITEIICPWIKIGTVKIVDPFKVTNLLPSVDLHFINILCITDDFLWASHLDSLVNKGTKYNIIISDKISKSIEYIIKFEPHIIIFSLHNLEISDADFCRIVVNIKPLQNITFISAIDEHNYESYIKAKAFGVSEYLSKKIIAKDLFKILKKYNPVR